MKLFLKGGFFTWCFELKKAIQALEQEGILFESCPISNIQSTHSSGIIFNLSSDYSYEWTPTRGIRQLKTKANFNKGRKEL